MEKQQYSKEEKRFVNLTVLFATMAGIILTCIAILYFVNRPAIILQLAGKDITTGRYDRAQARLNALQDGNFVLTDDQGQEMDADYATIDYEKAKLLYEQGNYEEAEESFIKLGQFMDARERALDCRYRQGIALKEREEYSDAVELFSSLGAFMDSAEQEKCCQYAMAEEMEQAGNYYDALKLFLSVGSYQDARERAVRIAHSITGERDADTALQLAQGYSREEMERMDALSRKRKSLPSGVLATGFYHTVGIRSDGGAIATGRNTEGQCDVSPWQEIAMVDAGAYHTVGLQKDGRVIATGRNTEGQCEVQDWQDIVAIACTDYGTAGLKKDGTVVTCGFLSYEDVELWYGVTDVAAGSYLIAGLRDGKALCSHSSGIPKDGNGFEQLAAVDCNTGYVLGLCMDGTVVSSSLTCDETDCIAISAASSGYMALRSDGSMAIRFFEQRNEFTFPEITEGIAIAMGGTHAAVLLEDGSVIARGDNTYGECDTSGWKLRTTPIYP